MYFSTAWTVRDRLAEKWAATQARYTRQDAKRVTSGGKIRDRLFGRGRADAGFRRKPFDDGLLGRVGRVGLVG